MKTIKTLLILAIFTTAFITSCNKDKALEQETYSKSSTARLNTELNNEDMEADINDFIDKLDNPSTASDMNYEEAFEYVEATLNYKYVNYDYSKCANTEEFTGEVAISVDADNNMTMAAIKMAYDSILNDWHNKYYSISETEKTPIVFDITEVTSTSVSYTMVVGYGYIDLALWGEGFIPATSTDFSNAAYEYNNRLYYHLNNNMIQWCTAGNRVYIPQVGLIQYLSHIGLPSGAADPLPPNNNNYCDFKLFYSHASLPNHHLSFNSKEYSFYYDQGYLLMTNYLNNNPNANYISQAYFLPIGNGQSPNFYMAMHQFSFYYGRRYITASNIYTL